MLGATADAPLFGNAAMKSVQLVIATSGE